MLIDYLILVNAIALFLMLADKLKAQRKLWRIPEAVLMLLALFGGSLGIFAGMYLFRHKTRHAKFSVGVPVILVLQVFIAIVILRN